MQCTVVSLGRALLLCSLVVVGCFSGCITQNNGISLAEIQWNFEKEMHNVTSFSFFQNGTMIQERMNGSQIISTSTSLAMYGIIDRMNQTYYYRVTSNSVNETGVIEITWETYLVDGVVYRGGHAQNYSGWAKKNASYSDYLLINGGTSVIDLLNVSTVSRLADEVVGSVPCYVLKADVNARTYYESTMNISQWSDVKLAYETLNKSINSSKVWTMMFWVDKETFQLLKEYYKKVEEYPVPFSRVTDEEVTTNHNQNAHLIIVLPSEARNATWSEW